ncbi:MAG: hypothetical protein WED04_08860 [Promethearchaeati archaeon SRVP18_Atabeyarchaeia-1]
MFDIEIGIGIIGQLLLSCFAIVSIAASYVTLGFMDFARYGVINYAILLVASSLTVVATIDNYRDFTFDSAAVIGSLFGIAAAILGMIDYGLAPLGIQYAPGYTYVYFSQYFYLPTIAGIFLSVLDDTILGVVMLSIGGFFIAQRRRRSRRPLWFFIGILYVIGGILGISLFFSLYEYYVLVPAGILGSLCLAVGTGG